MQVASNMQCARCKVQAARHKAQGARRKVRGAGTGAEKVQGARCEVQGVCLCGTHHQHTSTNIYEYIDHDIFRGICLYDYVCVLVPLLFPARALAPCSCSLPSRPLPLLVLLLIHSLPLLLSLLLLLFPAHALAFAPAPAAPCSFSRVYFKMGVVVEDTLITQL